MTAHRTIPAGADLDGTVAAKGDAHNLIRLLVALQEREGQHLTDLLHDGPMQEFTAVLLALGRARKGLTGEVADRLIAIEARLRETVMSLHRPPSALRSFNDAKTMIEMALERRVRDILADALDIEVDVRFGPPSQAELAVVIGVVQLLLLAGESAGRVAQATVFVRSDASGTELTVRAMPSGGPATGEAARSRAARLQELADAVGARVGYDPASGAWHAAMSLPRPG